MNDSKQMNRQHLQRDSSELKDGTTAKFCSIDSLDAIMYCSKVIYVVHYLALRLHDLHKIFTQAIFMVSTRYTKNWCYGK